MFVYGPLCECKHIRSQQSCVSVSASPELPGTRTYITVHAERLPWFICVYAESRSPHTWQRLSFCSRKRSWKHLGTRVELMILHENTRTDQQLVSLTSAPLLTEADLFTNGWLLSPWLASFELSRPPQLSLSPYFSSWTAKESQRRPTRRQSESGWVCLWVILRKAWLETGKGQRAGKCWSSAVSLPK